MEDIHNHAVGSIWMDLKEFLPRFKIKYDVYMKSETGWVLTEKDMIQQESAAFYNELKEKMDALDE